MNEHTFRTHDGTELFYRHWPAAEAGNTDTRGGAPGGWTSEGVGRALVLFHRGHEHSGRLTDVVGSLRAMGVVEPVFAWDARGHGRSPGERGHAESFADLVRDAEWFLRHLEAEHGVQRERTVAFGHSVGAVLVAAWVHDHAPALAGMVLAAPAFHIRLYVPAAIPGLRLMQRLRRGRDAPSFVQSYVKPRMLTHDRREAKRYADDPQITKQIATNILLDVHDTGRRLVQDAGVITTPALVMVAGADWVVDTKAQRRFYDGLRSEHKRLRWFPGMYHDLLHEEDRDAVLRESVDFVRDVWDRQGTLPDANGRARIDRAVAADREGFTRDEYEALTTPLPVVSPKRWGFAGQRAVLRTVGRLSDGVALGWRTGFDSGRSLEYVYENQASGRLGVGRLLDRAYLDAVGWQGIRQRREHLRTLIRRALDASREATGRPAHLLDIAAGCGRYSLDALAGDGGAEPRESDETALLRDANADALRDAAAAAQARGLSERVKTGVGDAFDEVLLAAAKPTPDVAVVSGLYELFPHNGPVRASLRGLSAAVRPGGFLVYTGQPWHPQVEMIARCLNNREDRNWVMRRRTTEELDALVTEAGFRKVEMLIDRWGIFTVSLAVKPDGATA